MIEEFSQVDTETIEVGLSHVVDRIVRQYSDFSLAFQKEAVQNAWDVRVDRKKGKKWELRIDCIQGKNCVIVEDFGTTGMNNSRWKAFLALWKPKKELSDAGGQGQGKFILMGASRPHILLVESKSREIPYKCRFLQDGKKDSQKEKLTISRFSKLNNVAPLNHQGTKVWVYDARKEFLDDLKSKEFLKKITSTWWQILQQPFNSKIYILGKQIFLPKLPLVEKEKIVLKNKKIGNYGRVKRLVLQLYEKELPELFTGVRVQRAQMAVIRIPFEVYDKEYKNRLSGYILFDEKLGPALKKVEKTDHCGFVYRPPWKEIKRLIEGEIEKFKEEVVPKKEKRRPVSSKLHDEIISKANQIIMEYMPELSSATGSVVPPIKPKTPPKLRIDNLTVDKREEVKFNEPVQRRCTVKNETNKLKKVSLKIYLKHRGRTIDEPEVYKFKIRSQERKTLVLSEIKLDNSYRKGKYTIRGLLKVGRHDLHTKATSFYLETKRPRLKSGFIKKWGFGEFPDVTIRNSRIRNGGLTINETHPDFENIWNSFKNRPRVKVQQIKFYVLKLILDEAIREFLKHHLRGDRDLEEEQLNEILDLRDKIYFEVYA